VKTHFKPAWINTRERKSLIPWIELIGPKKKKEKSLTRIQAAKDLRVFT